MRVAVIGAGATGLCAARHLTAADSGCSCVVYEQSDQLGGVWVYNESTGEDKYGIPYGSAMYRNLRTNLPTILMEFPGFPFINKKSFVAAEEVLMYLKSYATYYDLEKYIQFRHQVKRVIPSGRKWLVTTLNILKNVENVEEFDAVMVCNGHFSIPYMGDFPDTSEFEGKVRHSHSYKSPEPYKNKTVLIGGGGPSGVDISYDLAPFANKVYFSPRNKIHLDSTFPKNILQSPLVEHVKKNHVAFEDGSISDTIDEIIICTGYKYTFPFLSEECGVTLMEDKYVQPLYKHLININHPTMAFIGLNFRTVLFPLFHLQVQFFLKHLLGKITLPNKEQMLAELHSEIKFQQEVGTPIRKYHELGGNFQMYIENLCETADLEDLPPVVYKIYAKVSALRKYHLTNYRDAIFKVVDRENYEMNGLPYL